MTGSADCTARVWDLDATSAHTQGTHTGRVSGLVINGDTAITFGASCFVKPGSSALCASPPLKFCYPISYPILVTSS